MAGPVWPRPQPGWGPGCFPDCFDSSPSSGQTDCDHTDVGSYLLGQLDAAGEKRFKAHLASCSGCRAAEKEMRAVAVLGSAMAPDLEPPAGPQGTAAPARAQASSAHFTGLRGGDATAGNPQAHHQGVDGDKLPIELAALGGAKPRAHAEVNRTDEGVTVAFHSDHLPPAGLGYH